MGRIAGVTAEETRERLLQAAAAVVARRGYDGASIAEITSEAGLSSGAVYAHFGGKAELFTATVQAHCGREVERLLGGEGGADADIAALFARRGAELGHRDRAEGSLLVEAIVAAQRDPEVAPQLAAAVRERETLFAAAVREGQASGAIDEALAPETVARFVLMVALGSRLVAAMDLPATDQRDWSALIDALVRRLHPRRDVTNDEEQH